MGAEKLKLPMLWALRVFIEIQIDRQDGSVGRGARCIRPEFEYQNFIVEWQSHLCPTTAAVTTVNNNDGTISSSVCNLQLADEVCITYLSHPFGHSWDVLSSLIALLFARSTLFNIWLLKYVFVFMHVNVCSHACVCMTNAHRDWERSSPLELDPWTLRTEPESSARVPSTSHSWTISSASSLIFGCVQTALTSCIIKVVDGGSD